MTGDPKTFLWGALAMASWVAGLYFLRFWKLTRDRLFLWFFIAFWVFSLQWILLGLLHPSAETVPYVYGLRLVAFVLILVGIVDKNRGPRLP